MKLDKRTLDFTGFVSLGQHTPKHQQNMRADHALVFMFQPFRGHWVQVIGCFLTKDSAPSDVLHKLVRECVVLLGNIGYHVDAIVSDGAQWNRGVWTLLGVHTAQLQLSSSFTPEQKTMDDLRFPPSPEKFSKRNHKQRLVPRMLVFYIVSSYYLAPCFCSVSIILLCPFFANQKYIYVFFVCPFRRPMELSRKSIRKLY